jgi:hypothetical protein
MGVLRKTLPSSDGFAAPQPPTHPHLEPAA